MRVLNNDRWYDESSERVIIYDDYSIESYARDGDSESWETDAIWESNELYYYGRMGKTRYSDSDEEYCFRPECEFESKAEALDYFFVYNK